MLILNPTRKSRRECCSGCKAGKPCCGAKPARPKYEKRGGLWLPRKFAPTRNLLGYPSRLEWPGGFVWPGLPPLVQYDMSCMPCCNIGCCEGFGTAPTTAFLDASLDGDCAACAPNNAVVGVELESVGALDYDSALGGDLSINIGLCSISRLIFNCNSSIVPTVNTVTLEQRTGGGALVCSVSATADITIVDCEPLLITIEADFTADTDVDCLCGTSPGATHLSATIYE